ncbi:DeoR/GlpR family DNA-binding transcription regulator [Streptomyces sp. NPDC090741]|uniref:DeoR/GlpR family DNA-binding transcription regulator n=1 Tax=Streptomyces sp. NPDC090741 TaxID=3365967 RepID=UPI003818BD2E
MEVAERQRVILSQARDKGSVEVSGLAVQLAVSSETIRRDLRMLASCGLLRRTHGGAYPVESRAYETSLETRTNRHVPQKRRIAVAAAGLLGPAETVFIDEGFTLQLIAEALPEDRPLTVLTPALGTAQVLSLRDNVTVLLLGGQVRGRTQATVGPWASRMLSGFVIDMAYVGANGISREHGLTTPDPAVAEIKSQAMKAARRKVFCGVHTKFGAVSFCRFADFREFETIVTDTDLPSAEAQRYARAGSHVLRV